MTAAMLIKISLGVVLFLASLMISKGLVSFDKRFSYQEVDESKLNGANLADPKNTGSKLFDSATIDKNKKLGTYIYIKDFKSPTSKYFRAHPVFLQCLDKVFSKLDHSKAGHRLLLDSGFKTKAEAASGKEHDLYARAGAGAVIIYRQDSKVKDVMDIAKQAVWHCPAIFASIQRDLGLVLLAKGVGIHMRGPDDKQPYYASDGGAKSTADFKNWCLDTMDRNFDNGPKHTDCTMTGLANGATYPAGAKSPEQVVGSLDAPVIRSNVDDFKRLFQFEGRVIDFENPQASSTWCGQKGNPCRSCSNGIYGSGLNDRCAIRVMSPRMYNALKALQLFVRKGMNDKLVVTKTWDEAHSAAPNGDTPKGSLHKEGRQVEAKLKSGGSLVDLTKYAICAGIDYVKNNGASVTLAVRKQKTTEERKIKFGDAELLEVAVPSADKNKYRLPPNFSEKDKESMPLFDAELDKPLGDGVTLSMFRSDEYRYVRLNPGIVKCFALMKKQVKKEFNKDLQVETGFRSTTEWRQETEPDLDERGLATTYGDAMHIVFPGFCPYRLAEIAVDQCAKIANNDEEQALGIGLFSDFLYLDIRYDFNIWEEKSIKLPKGCSSGDDFRSKLELRFNQIILDQRIDPDDPATACANADPPKPQSSTYKFVHPKSTKEKRRRRRSAKPDDECKPRTDTVFCKETQKHRDAVVADIWEEITRKAHDKPMIEIRKALEGCLGRCGTCLEGSVWEDKIEHCQNLIHWVAFRTLNEDSESHFYSSDNMVARGHAYRHHCFDRSALYGLFADSVKRIYRPDPNKSIKEQLYSPEDNPSPLMDLTKQLYAFYARGKGVVWVNDDKEASSLLNQLKVLMVYNKKMTSIDVMVPDKQAANTVGTVLENAISEWTKSSCPTYSREYITPFKIVEGWPTPAKRGRRGTEDEDHRESLIRQMTDFETNWIEEEFEP